MFQKNYMHSFNGCVYEAYDSVQLRKESYIHMKCEKLPEKSNWWYGLYSKRKDKCLTRDMDAMSLDLSLCYLLIFYARNGDSWMDLQLP